jgi:hypothetical protein
MFYANSMIPQIDKNYLVYAVEVAPRIFMGVAVAVMGAGAILFRTRARPKKEYF